jgi:4-amino-4-deoxy-L-arabinose transferase-like glycosyltransferase
MERPKMTSRSRLAIMLLFLVIAVSAFAYFAACRPERFGFYRDDSMYVVMAKALATKQGYRVLSLPGEPLQAKSPPFYPFLLSLIWWAQPHFPDNLLCMTILSIAATVCFLAVAWRYLVEHGYATHWQALAVVALVGINWRTIVLAGGVYSEMVYAALSVLALYLTEEYEKHPQRWVAGLLSGVLVGLAFLTRSAGIALLLALACYYLIRRFKRGLLPVAIAATIVLGWLAWGRIHESGYDSVNAGFYESYFSTFSQVVGGQQAQGFAGMLKVVSQVVGTNAVGLMFVSVPVVCLGLNYDAAVNFRFGFPIIAAAVPLLIAGGFLRQVRERFRLMHMYVLSYMVVHLLWPYTAYDRFLMPLLPFFLLFFVIETGPLWLLVKDTWRLPREISKKLSAALIAVVVVSAAGIALFNYGLGLIDSMTLSTLTKVARPSPEDGEAIEWINANTQPSDVLICYRDPLYYLYTDRKATRSVFSRRGGLLDDQGGVEEMSKAFLRIVEDNKAGYVVFTDSDFELESKPDVQRDNLLTILQQNPGVFVPVFHAGDGRSAIYRIDD